MYWDKQGALLVNRLGRSNSITLILVKYGMFSCMLANKLLHCMKYLLYSWLLLPSFRWVLHVQLQNFSQTKGQFLQFAFQDFLTDEEAETTDILYRAKQGAFLVNRLGRTNSLINFIEICNVLWMLAKKQMVALHEKFNLFNASIAFSRCTLN